MISIMSEQPDRVERQDSLSTIAAGEDQDLFIDDDLGTIFYDGDDVGSECENSKIDDVKQDGTDSETLVAGHSMAMFSSGTEKQPGPEGPAKTRKLSWQCEESDKNHRSTMILEIETVLKARKSSSPSKKWLQQLPHKARKLEEGLYRTAPSLDAYLDRTTLKNRLKVIARLITRKYLSTRRSSERSSLTSRTSHRTSVSSTTSQITRSSVDSLSSLRKSMQEKVNTSVARNEPGDRVLPLPIQQESQIDFNAEPLSEGSHHSGSYRTSPENMVNSQSIASDLLMNQRIPQRQEQQQHQNPSSFMSSNTGKTDFEQQTVLNAKLQEQLMDNMRMQEDLFLRLQAGRRASGQGAQSTLNAATPVDTLTGLSSNSIAYLQSNRRSSGVSASEQSDTYKATDLQTPWNMNDSQRQSSMHQGLNVPFQYSDMMGKIRGFNTTPMNIQGMSPLGVVTTMSNNLGGVGMPYNPFVHGGLNMMAAQGFEQQPLQPFMPVQNDFSGDRVQMMLNPILTGNHNIFNPSIQAGMVQDSGNMNTDSSGNRLDGQMPNGGNASSTFHQLGNGSLSPGSFKW